MTVQEPTPVAEWVPRAAVRAALEELLAESAFAMDDHDYDRYAGFFTLDATYDVGGEQLHGREAIVRRFTERVGERTTRHFSSGLRIASRSDGAWEARSTWLSFAASGRPPFDHVPLYQVADFRDEIVRVGPDWLIRRRTITSVFREPQLAPGR